jgi:hypothetical protein
MHRRGLGRAHAGSQFKAAWYGAELLGRVFGGAKQDSDTPDGAAAAAPLEAISWQDALAEIRADFDDNYFISGDAEMGAYEADCEFADPFTSFTGVQRFKRNLSNFGALMCVIGPCRSIRPTVLLLLLCQRCAVATNLNVARGVCIRDGSCIRSRWRQPCQIQTGAVSAM